MENQNMKRNVSIGLFLLAALVVLGAVLNCFANAGFGAMTLEVLGEDTDLGSLRASVMSAGVVGAILMVLTGWQTLKNGNPRLRFLLGLATTLLLTVFTVFCRQQGGNFLSRVVNTLGMICAFLTVAIANRDRQ